MISKHFGKKLKELRLRDNETPLDLAKCLSTTSRQIQRYEEGLIPRLDKLKALSGLYKFDFIQMINEDLEFGAEQREIDEQIEAEGGPTQAYIKSLIDTISVYAKRVAVLEERVSALTGKKGSRDNLSIVS